MSKQLLKSGWLNLLTLLLLFSNDAAGSENPVTAFREANDPAMKSNDASRATNSYLEQYKEDVIKGGKIGEARSANIHNAYNTVIGSDI